MSAVVLCTSLIKTEIQSNKDLHIIFSQKTREDALKVSVLDWFQLLLSTNLSLTTIP